MPAKFAGAQEDEAVSDQAAEWVAVPVVEPAVDGGEINKQYTMANGQCKGH
jgi:hypothetical protein